MHKAKFFYLLIVLLQVKIVISAAYHASEKFILLNPNAKDISRVIFNSIEDTENFIDNLEEKIKVETPLLNPFLDSEIRLFEDFINSIPDEKNSKLNNINRFIAKITFEDTLSLLNFCDAFDVKDALEPIKENIIFKMYSALKFVKCDDFISKFAFLQKAKKLQNGLHSVYIKDQIVKKIFSAHGIQPFPFPKYIVGENSQRYVNYDTNRVLEHRYMVNNQGDKTSQQESITLYNQHTGRIIKKSYLKGLNKNRLDPKVSAWDGNNLVIFCEHSNQLSPYSINFYVYNIHEDKITASFGGEDYSHPVFINYKPLNPATPIIPLCIWMYESHLHLYDIQGNKEITFPETIYPIINNAGTLFTTMYINRIKLFQLVHQNRWWNILQNESIPNTLLLKSEIILSDRFIAAKMDRSFAVNESGSMFAYFSLNESKEFITLKIYDIARATAHAVYDSYNNELHLSAAKSIVFNLQDHLLFVLANGALIVIDTLINKEIMRINLQNKAYKMSINSTDIIFDNRGNKSRLPLYVVNKMLEKYNFNVLEGFALKLAEACKGYNLSDQDQKDIERDSIKSDIVRDISEEIQELVFGKVLIKNSTANTEPYQELKESDTTVEYEFEEQKQYDTP